MSVGLCAATTLLIGAGSCDRSSSLPELKRLSIPAATSQPNVPLAAIYVESPLPINGTQVVLAIYEDGRIVWSQDQSGGGPPYLVRAIDEKDIKVTIESLESMGVSSDRSLNVPNWGPDATHAAIAIADGPRTLLMESWHEIFESDSNIVVTSRGVEALNGRNRQAVLNSQPRSYRYYRKT
jgi:hypothetical protein